MHRAQIHPLNHALKLALSPPLSIFDGTISHATNSHSHWVTALLASLVACLFFSTALTNIAAALVSITALVYWWRYRPWGLLRTPLALWCMTLLAWILLRDVAVGSGWAAAWGQVNDFRPLIFVVLWAPLFAHSMHRQVVAATFGVCMAFFCAVVLAVTLWTGAPAYITFYHRAPDLSGPLLVIAIVAAAQMALTQKQKRLLWWAGAVLGSAALFLATNRRTGYVVFFLCGIALAFLYSQKLNVMKWRSLILGITLVASLTVMLLLSSSTARLGLIKVADEIAQFSKTNSMQQGELHTSSGLRLRLWSITREVIKEAPWVGSGLSQFPNRYRLHDTRMGGSELVVKNPHNEYLYILAGLGAVGLGLYLAIQWQVVRQARRFTNRAQRNILWLAMLAFMSSIFFNSMIIDMVPGHFFALTVLCLGWFDWPADCVTPKVPA